MEKMPTVESKEWSGFKGEENLLVETYQGVARKVGNILKAFTDTVEQL